MIYMGPTAVGACLRQIAGPGIGGGDAKVDVSASLAQLSRSPAFQRFAVRCCERLLPALSAGVNGARDEHRQAIAHVSAPLFLAARVLALSAEAPGAAAGGKSEGDDLLYASLKCVDRVCRAFGGELAHLVSVFRNVPVTLEGVDRDVGHQGGATEEGGSCHQVLLSRMHHLQRMVRALLEARRLREAEVVLGLTLLVTSRLPIRTTQGVCSWADTLASTHTLPGGAASRGVARALVLLCVAQAAPMDVSAAMKFANALVEVRPLVEDDSGGDLLDQSEAYSIVDEANAEAVADVLLGVCDSTLDEVVEELDLLVEGGVGSQSAEAHGAASERFESLVCLLYELCGSRMTGSTLEHLLKISARTYAGAAKLVKPLLPPRKKKGAADSTTLPLTSSFLKAVTQLHQLTPRVYEASRLNAERATEEEAAVAESRGKRKAANVAAIKREARLLPAVVFEVEGAEKALIEVSASRGVDLMKGAKRGEARDFKIEALKALAQPASAPAKRARVQQEEEQEEVVAVEEEQEQEAEDDDDDENEDDDEEEEDDEDLDSYGSEADGVEGEEETDDEEEEL